MTYCTIDKVFQQCVINFKNVCSYFLSFEKKFHLIIYSFKICNRVRYCGICQSKSIVKQYVIIDST